MTRIATPSTSRLWAALLPLAAACSSTPAEIDVQPSFTITHQRFLDLDATVRDAEGEALSVEARATAVSDPTVLKLGNNGELQCAGYGDVSVTLSAPPAEATTLVKCRLVARLDVSPDALAFALNPDPKGVVRPIESSPLKVTAYGPQDVVLSDVEVTMTTDNPSVARVEDGRVQVRQRGATVLRVAAGDEVVEVPIEVSVVAEERRGIVIADGDVHGLPLEAGRYRVTLGSDQPVEARVSQDCRTAGADVEQTFDCTLTKGGALRIENPAFFGFGGGDATVHVRALRLP